MKAKRELHLGGLIFIVGLGVLLAALLNQLGFGGAPMEVGQGMNALGGATTGAGNIVTSVVLSYRGLDTLGELTILFTAATGAGMLLARSREAELADAAAPGAIVRIAADLLFPFLLLLGFYIIIHGHVSPGGGFQGGAILAAAYFVPLLTGAGRGLDERSASLIEGLAGAAFIAIGLLALAMHHGFLAPIGPRGTLGHLFSAGSLPLLSSAIGLKVGAELAGVLAHMGQLEEKP